MQLSPSPLSAGNPGEFAMLQLAEAILRLFNSKSKLVFALLPSDDPKQRQPDITLAKAKLGWEPEVNLEDGPNETIAHFKNDLTCLRVFGGAHQILIEYAARSIKASFFLL